MTQKQLSRASNLRRSVFSGTRKSAKTIPERAFKIPVDEVKLAPGRAAPVDRKELRKMGKKAIRAARDPQQVRKSRKAKGDAFKPLTRREERFVRIMTTMDGMITKREAAIQAGYPSPSAHVRASELTNPLKKPNVVRALEEARAEIDQQYKVTKSRHLRDLWRIREAAIREGKFGPAVAAEVARGKAHGDIYVNKTQVTVGTIDSMTREEVDEELEKLQRRLGVDDGSGDAITESEET